MLAYVDFGSGESNISDYIISSSFKRTLQLCNEELCYVVNKCSFEIKGSTTLKLQIMNSDDTTIRITEDDGTAYFKGKVRGTFETKISSQVGNLKVELVDNLDDITATVETVDIWSGYKICDSSNTSASILHQLFYLAGYSSSDLSLVDVDVTIPYFYLEEDTAVIDIISDLTFQYGQVINCELDGTFKNYSIYYDDLTTSSYLNNTNIYGELGIKKVEEKYKSVKVIWNPIEYAADKVVFSDITNGTTLLQCNIELEPSQYYQDDDEIFANYTYNDEELVYVENASLDISCDADISYSITEAPKGAYLSIQNTNSTINENITKLDITGDVYYKGAQHTEYSSNISDTKDIEEIEASYIFEEAYAQNLASYHAVYYKYSDFKYTAKSKDYYPIGTLVLINETAFTNLDVTGFVSQIVDDGTGYYTYTIYSVSEFSAQPITTKVSTISKTNTQISIPTIVEEVSNNITVEGVPTYNEINTGASLLNEGSATTTIPDVPTVVVEEYYKSLRIVYDVQDNLSNFSHYEIQVSADESNWYSLASGSNWKDTLNDTTATIFYYHTHAGIPNSGTSQEPTGTTLSYRVRRVTSANVESDWSDVVTGTTKIIETGDVAASSITADKIEAGSITSDKLSTDLLQTQIAQVSGSITIDSSYGFVGVDNDTKRRVYLDTDEVVVEQYNETTGDSVVQCRMGGKIKGAPSSYIIGNGLIKNENVEIPTAIPDTTYKFTFETDFSDTTATYYFSNDTETTPTIDTSKYVFGTHSMKLVSTNGESSVSDWFIPTWTGGNPFFFASYFYIPTGTTAHFSFQVGAVYMDCVHLGISTLSGWADGYVTKDGVDCGATGTIDIPYDEWFLCAISYDPVLDTLSVSVNDNYITASIDNSTAWAGSTDYMMGNIIYWNDTSESIYMDETVLDVETFIDISEAIKQYSRTETWNIGEDISDNLYLIPGEGGSVIIGGDITFSNAFTLTDAEITTLNTTTLNSTNINGTQICAGYDPNVDNSVSCSNWFRSSGNTGWYNATYAGGLYMVDTTYVRTYNGKYFYANRVYGAVGNDYADAIEIDEELNVDFGYVYVRTAEGKTRKSTKYAEKGIIGITTNTQSFTAHSYDGEKDRLPISVSGFVLAHTDRIYKSGTPLTSSKNGLLTKASLITRVFKPERVIATFYKEISQNTWNDVDVNKRNIVRVK